MNIAIFVDTYPPYINGVATSSYNLCQTLKDHGNNVIVVTARFDAGKLEYKDGVLYMPGLEFKKLYGYRFTSFYSKTVMRYLKEFKVDLIHDQTDAPIGQFARIAAKELKVPFVYTYHTSYEDYTYYVTHGVFDRAAKRVVRKYSIDNAKLASGFITPSEKTKEYMRYAGSDAYISVIPTGIDFSLFAEDKIDIERTKKFKSEHHIDDDTKVFLILGRLAKEKSMDVSINGVHEFHLKHPEIKIKLLIVGGGPARQELEYQVNNLQMESYTDFIGPVNAKEVPFYYHLADIYTSASITETQGLTFMEAMASRVVVLARFDTNLTGTIIDGVTGYLFMDETGFVLKAYKILTMEKEQLNKMKEQALALVDKYSIDKFYSNIMEVYIRAIKKRW